MPVRLVRPGRTPARAYLVQGIDLGFDQQEC